ncbi:hypothetical protein NXW84_03605 [Bacteroides fragilis]|nr:hypothetical protein NXW84_03605 [Bacteroides fragilis]
MEKGKVGEGKIHIIILYRGKFIGEREKGICREREKEKCLREEIEEKIEILTEGKQKIRRDCDKD